MGYPFNFNSGWCVWRTSAIPGLAQDAVPLGLIVIALLLTGNVRGVREAGAIFSAPTYAFHRSDVRANRSWAGRRCCARLRARTGRRGTAGRGRDRFAGAACVLLRRRRDDGDRGHLQRRARPQEARDPQRAHSFDCDGLPVGGDVRRAGRADASRRHRPPRRPDRPLPTRAPTMQCHPSFEAGWALIFASSILRLPRAASWPCCRRGRRCSLPLADDRSSSSLACASIRVPEPKLISPARHREYVTSTCGPGRAPMPHGRNRRTQR
jgi:hypothetical protein